MTPADTLLMLIGLLFGFCSLSFLWFGTSIAFDIAESTVIAGECALGLFSVIIGLRSTVFNPLLGGQAWLIIALVAGLLIFTRLSRYRWLARYPVAISSGVGIGVMLGLTVRSQMLDPVGAVIGDIVNRTPDPFTPWLNFVGSVCVLVFFLYSARLSTIFHEGKLRLVARFGRIFLYASFGYLYSSIFVNEGVDSLISYMLLLVRRPLQALGILPV